MEPAEASLIKTYVKGHYAGFEAAILGLENCLVHRLHPDFAMDRVIRETIIAIINGMKEALKETQCPPSPTINPTNSQNF